MSLLVFFILIEIIFINGEEPIKTCPRPEMKKRLLPVSLSVLQPDLKFLADSWLDLSQKHKLISYSDNIKFVVKFERPHHETNLVSIEGSVNVVRSYSDDNRRLVIETGEEILVPRLYFDGSFYRKDPLEHEDMLRLVNPEQYVINNYVLPEISDTLIPSIEYKLINEIKEEVDSLKETLSELHRITGSGVIKTFSLFGTMNLKVGYDPRANTALLMGDFILTTIDPDTHTLEKFKFTVNMNYHFKFRVFDEEMTDPLYSMRVLSKHCDDRSPNLSIPTLRLKWPTFIEDVVRSRPKSRNDDSFGVIDFSESSRFIVELIKRMELTMRRVTGDIRTPGGTLHSTVCLFHQDDLQDQKFKLIKESVVFECNTGEILSDDKLGYIDIVDGKTKTKISIDSQETERYIQYISYENFLSSFKTLADASLENCRHSDRVYKMYSDVSVTYDPSSHILSVEDPLFLWVKPEDEKSPWVEIVSKISYDDERKTFFDESGNEISNFKVCQYYPSVPGKVATEMLYTEDGRTYGAFVMEALEWDLANIQEEIATDTHHKMHLQKVGLVRVDEYMLLKAELSTKNKVKRGKNLLKMRAKLRVEQCNTYCLNDYKFFHIGETLKDYLSDKYYLPNTVFLPVETRVSKFDKKVEDLYEVRYIQLGTFMTDIRTLSDMLKDQCEILKGKKLFVSKITFNLNYFGSLIPIIGYFHCDLHYVFIASDFKIMNHPKSFEEPFSTRIEKEEPTNAQDEVRAADLKDEKTMLMVDVEGGSSESEDHLKFIPVELEEAKDELESSWKEDPMNTRLFEISMKRKPNKYLINEIIYDLKADSMTFSSIYPRDVYALRFIPETESSITMHQGEPIRSKLPSGAKVLVYPEDELERSEMVITEDDLIKIEKHQPKRKRRRKLNPKYWFKNAFQY